MKLPWGYSLPERYTFIVGMGAGILFCTLLFGGWFTFRINGIEGKILDKALPAMVMAERVGEKHVENLKAAEDGILSLQDRSENMIVAIQDRSEQRMLQLHEQFLAHVEQTEKRNREMLTHFEETAGDVVRTLCVQDKDWCAGFELRSGLLNVKKRQDALEEQMRLQTKALEELTKGK